jgi:hypothetical protein
MARKDRDSVILPKDVELAAWLLSKKNKQIDR